ncbi:DUF1127 domain-containing protein [Mesorhizobium sp. BR1-1-9]|nr:DUF1127 domain-containing protein [Mesorhizobium sp. ESP-6-2]MBZ9870224.1 DUF1127 domain-containing protein [Mesorhizobium sp. BR1-1-9]
MEDALLKDIGISPSEIGLAIHGLKHGHEDKTG